MPEEQTGFVRWFIDMMLRKENLLSLVFVGMTAVFAYKEIMGAVFSDEFKMVFSMVVAFYYGTHTSKKDDTLDGG